MQRLAAIALVLLCGGPAAAEHALGARRQWQPQLAEAGLDPDHRLEQQVEAEILGRAAIPALEMLSQATGVSLSVAPENLDTVGERKLTVISKGLTLKTVMAQIPEALQECHWDIDASGESPIYLLHRNASVEEGLYHDSDQRRARYLADWTAARATRLEEVKSALAMSPAALAKLEATDPFLARAAQQPIARRLMEAFLSLPDDAMQQLLKTGYVQFPYGAAPEEVKQALRLAVERERGWFDWMRAWPPGAEQPFYDDEIDYDKRPAERQEILDGRDDMLVWYADQGMVAGLGGVWLWVDSPEFAMPVIPARYPRMDRPGSYYQFLLMESGNEDREAALEIVRARFREGLRLRDQRQWDESDWVEPSDPRLQQQLPLPSVSGERGEYVEFGDLKRLIAERTGLSVISDHFTDELIGAYPGQRPLGGPLWRDLYTLGQAARFEWKLVGDCLVFHRENWYWLSQRELPESFIERWRAKLEDQERFTLDDIVQFAVEFEHRPQPRLRGVGRFAIPRDLLDAGADAASGPFRGMLLLYHALTPEERAAARSANGLSLSQLPPAKRERVTEHVCPPGMQSAMLQTRVAEFVSAMVFFVRESYGEEQGRSFTRYEFRLQHPDEPGISADDWTLTVHLPEQPSE